MHSNGPNALRAKAEAQLSIKPGDHPPEELVYELIDELKVHQIELEIINEELRRSHAELEESRDLYIELYDFAPVGYLTLTAEGLIEQINLTAASMLGMDRDQLLNCRFAALVAPQDADAWYLFFGGVMRHYERQNIELRLKRGDGAEFYVQLDCLRSTSVNQESILRITLTDITINKNAADKIHYLAYYDPLTLLPNRSLFHERLSRALVICRRCKSHGALVFIDLDNFKALNDTLGHDTGDMLLTQVAKRLVIGMREGDTVARLGGDEFVIILEELSRDPIEAAIQANEVGEKILTALNRNYLLSGYDYHNTPSIGVTLFNNQDDIDSLLKRADIAMYAAKAAGRNTLRFFDQEMQTAVTERAALETDLIRALEEHQFKLYFQLQATHDRRILGAEVLRCCCAGSILSVVWFRLWSLFR